MSSPPAFLSLRSSSSIVTAVGSLFSKATYSAATYPSSPLTDTFIQSLFSSRNSSSSSPETLVITVLPIPGFFLTFSSSTFTTTTVFISLFSFARAMAPVVRYSFLTKPSTCPDLICTQPSSVTVTTSQTVSFGILPTIFPSNDGISRTFRASLSTLEIPGFSYPSIAALLCQTV